MKFYYILQCALVFFCTTPIAINLVAQPKVGDPGVSFNQATIAANSSCYPQMQRWSQAGVIGGIPFLSDFDFTSTINPGDSDDIMAAIDLVANSISANQKGLVILSDGNYTIDKQVNMKSNVSLAGQSRNGAVLNVSVQNANAIYFDGITFAGLYDLTIKGTWGKPTYNWNYGISENDELGFSTNGVKLENYANNCWIDRVSILDIADSPVVIVAQHITIREVYIDGTHKKGGGGQGYFSILGADNLITGCYVTHLRHISMQKSPTATHFVDYNVLYDNDFDQEISFHTRDDGNNLIENNRIILPYDMPPVAPGDADNVTPIEAQRNKPNYFAIMGPWSSIVNHVISANPNYIINNQCEQNNHNYGSNTPWSQPGKVYSGPIQKGLTIQQHIDNFPLVSGSCETPNGGTLYPIINCIAGIACDDQNSCTINDKYDANCTCVGTAATTDDDMDGICNAQDQCPNYDDNLIGSFCDDGNECTTNDAITSNCICAGTLIIANTQPLIAVADAYVRGGTYADNNYGTGELLTKNTANDTYERLSYIKFDLSNYGANNFSSAFLQLHVSDNSTNNLSQKLSETNDDGWTENSITWNNQPTSDSLISNFTIPISGNNVQVDISQAVVATLNTDKILTLKLEGSGTEYIKYLSREFNTANAPQLLLSFDACEPCTDSDNDGVCDADDTCIGGDDNVDTDNDNIADACDDCLPIFLELSNPNITLNKQANVSIFTNGIIAQGLIIDYKAGDLVELKQGFEVLQGAEFSANIANCQ